MRFPRTIRLDGTDTRVFENAAEPGEWAVTGAFVFADADPAAITGKHRQAFRNGFLGTVSFGWSTLVAVANMDESQYQSVIEALAAHFVTHYGAPDLAAARPVARDEAAFAASLCEHPVNTLLAVDRKHGDQNHGDDGIVERFHVIQSAADGGAVRPWELVNDDPLPGVARAARQVSVVGGNGLAGMALVHGLGR